MPRLNRSPFFAALAFFAASTALTAAGAEPGLGKGEAAPVFMAYPLQDAAAGSSDSGKAVKMSALFGSNPVVLSFFTKECAACKTEIPVLQELARAYAAKGIRFFLVLVRTPAFPEKEIMADVLAREYRLPVLWHRYPETVFKKYLTAKDGSTLGVPLLYFIDRKGTVSKVHQGFETGDAAKATASLQRDLDALAAP